MGVKPVEYIKPSSTTGFVTEDDVKAGGDKCKKTITKTNANTIQKDVDQGNTKDLDRGQEGLLGRYVDEDTIDYSAEETRNVGRNQIDTKGEDGEELSEKDSKAGGVAAASVAAGSAAATAAAATIMVTTKGVKEVADLGKHIPGGMLAAGIVALAGGVATLVLSGESIFDPNISERKAQTSAADQNNQTIQNYIDVMSSNMDSMDADLAGYTAACEQKCADDVEASNTIAEIQAQIIEYRAQGNEEKVAELTAQMEDYKKEAELLGAEGEDSMNVYKENIEEYRLHNEEALGVAESGTIVSEFLKDGVPMKNYAKAAQIASYVGVAAMAIGVIFASIRIGKDLAGIFTAPFASPDSAGMLMFIAGGVLMGTAASNFGKRAESEGAAGNAGNTMSEYLAQLNENTTAQSGYTEETAGAYSALDAAAAEEVGKTEEGNQEANQDLAGRVLPTLPGDEKKQPDDGNDDNGNA